MPDDWGRWCERWHATSTLTSKARQITLYYLFRAGRWLAAVHPEVTSPEQWTREFAAEYVAAVDRLTVDQMEWLGHRDPAVTMHYVKVAPTRLAKAYADAGYFARNVRAIEVLIDQEVVESGGAARGEPWRFYDLGHGYCTYKFFDQCPHRMACAKCSFYRPKGSSQAQLLEGRANLLRFRQDIPLTEEEQAAVDDGLAAMEKLLERLANLPTPDSGPAARQRGLRPLPLVPSSRTVAE